MESSPPLDLEHLLKLRLVVARIGETDNAGWWNTKGVLSSTGNFVYTRGLPRTHWWAQARLVFAVAAARCREVFSAKNSITLWDLPAAIEDAFEDKWQEWMDEGEKWNPFFTQITALQSVEILQALQGFGLVTPQDVAAVQGLKSTSEIAAVSLGVHSSIDNAAVTLLATGFTLAASGKLVIPYMRMED